MAGGADEGGGAAMFKQYANDAQSHGRAVHVTHDDDDGGADEGGGAAMFKQYANDAQSHGRAVHVTHEDDDDDEAAAAALEAQVKRLEAQLAEIRGEDPITPERSAGDTAGESPAAGEAPAAGTDWDIKIKALAPPCLALTQPFMCTDDRCQPK